MTSRQCEIAAESYTASLLAQSGYDVLVQYGAHQPHYDLVASKIDLFIPVSVKGSQDGGWMLAVKHKNRSRTYHEAIDMWCSSQREDVVFFFVQFWGVGPGHAPRVYIARRTEIAEHLKTQCDGRGYGALQENPRNQRPRSKYSHKIPDAWRFSEGRLSSIASI